METESMPKTTTLGVLLRALAIVLIALGLLTAYAWGHKPLNIDYGLGVALRVGGTALRLDETTQVDIARLDEDALEAFIPRGIVSVRVRHFDAARRLVFDTPYARITLRGDGRYRIDVDPEREEARITVFAGDARVGSDSGRVRVRANQTVRIFGGDYSSYVVESAYADPFDKWAASRDAKWVETRSVRYVSPDMTGYDCFVRIREVHEHLPVILMTGFGYDPSHSIVKARQMGLKSVLYKPFRLDQLLKELEAAVSTPEA